jgi:exodeoxyribonuclease-3
MCACGCSVETPTDIGRGGGRGDAVTVATVRIATWNVNSVKQRMPRLLPWLDERRPDVVCLQETKLADDAFIDLLGAELRDRGYAVAVHGEATWNGVAILSRVGLDDVVVGLTGAPGFPLPEARAVSATCGGIRVVSVYVPNGRAPDSEHYRYKLAWLAALRDSVASGPTATVVCGDMNIAPTDEDVRPRGLRRTDPRHPARARGSGGAPGTRVARRPA